MAVNRTRLNGFHQKHKVSVFVAGHVDYTWLTADGGTGSILLVLPSHSIVTHLVLIEEEAANSAAKFDITVGGIALITNGALDANTEFHASDFDNVHMEAGGDVIFKQGGSPPTQGNYTFVMEYTEHKLHSGEYTNFSNA